MATLAFPTDCFDDRPRWRGRAVELDAATPAELAAALASLARAERDQRDPEVQRQLLAHALDAAKTASEAVEHAERDPRASAAERRMLSRHHISCLSTAVACRAQIERLRVGACQPHRGRSSGRTVRSRRTPTSAHATADPDGEPPGSLGAAEVAS